MKRLWVLAFVFALALVYTAPAQAQGLKAQGVYIGASGGVALTKLDFDNINILDDTSVVWKAAAGYRWRNFAIEFDYRALQEVKSVIPGSEITAKANGFAGSALLLIPLGPVDLFGRVGGFRATTEIGTGGNIAETKEWALVYGGGLGIRIGSFSLRAEYERPQLDAITELHQLTAGFTVAF